MVREAMPYLTKGKAAFESAGQALAVDQKPGTAADQKPDFQKSRASRSSKPLSGSWK